MNKNITELIGTFFLVLTIGLSGNPIAIGVMLMSMVYAGGAISGAHYNPAVTLAALIRKRISAGDAMKYMVFQCIGSFLAALVIYLTFKTPMSPPAPAPGFAYQLKPLMLEILFTFALVTVVANVAINKKTAGNHYFGIAIGFTVMASAFAAGPVSGGAFNPAVAIGPTIIDSIKGGSSLGNLWIYLVGPFTGGILAALVFPIMNPEEKNS
jgi:aquaporin Z